MSVLLPFTKMHGAGNDFVMVAGADLDRLGIAPDRALIAGICRRRTAVGADGLIVVAAASEPDLDFRMTYYNSDGGEAEMCGNGARCAFAFARSLGLAGEAGVFGTASGPVTGSGDQEGIAIGLTPPSDIRLDVETRREHPFGRIHHADSGVPHLVIPVPNVEAVDIPRWGPALRSDPAFAPDGANVNWVQPHPTEAGVFLLRTYERGVESETLACGTGSAATALILVELGLAASPVALLTRGGYRLTIGVEKSDAGIRLSLHGPAAVAFKGEVEIDG